MRHRWLCAALPLLQLTHTFAQSASAPMTMEDAVDRALNASPRIAAAVAEIKAARQAAIGSRALPNPELVATPGLSATGSDEELIIRQPLGILSRSARVAMADANVRAARAGVAMEFLDVAFATRIAYCEVIRARDLHALATDLAARAEELDRMTQRLIEEGLRPGIDRTQVGIEVTLARRRVADAKARMRSAEAELNTLMGRPVGEPIGELKLPEFSRSKVDEEDLITRALAASPAVAAEVAGAEAHRQEARLTRAEGMPDLAPQFRATSITRGVTEAGLGIGIALPIVDWGSRTARVRQAQLQAEALAHRAEEQRQATRLRVVKAIERVRAAEAAIDLLRDGVVERARRMLEVRKVGLAEGQTDILVLLDAQRAYRTVQTDYTDALIECAEACIELDRAIGNVPDELLARLENQPK